MFLFLLISLFYGESFEESDKCDLDGFFRSHPALEHLHLEYGSIQDIEMEVSFAELDESDDAEDEDTDEFDDVSASFSDVTFNHIRTIKVKGITGTTLEMHLIKLLLAKSH